MLTRLKITHLLQLILCSIICLHISCKQKPHKAELLVDKFTFSALYISDRDSLYLRPIKYIEIDKYGNCRIMAFIKYTCNKDSGYNTKDTLAYFTTIVDDSLIKQINALYINKVCKNLYNTLFHDSLVACVDGPTYYMQFDSTETKEKAFFYACNPPAELRHLQTTLDSLICYSHKHIVPAFDLTTYLMHVKEQCKKIPLLPPPPKTVHFTPPQIKPGSY